MIKKLLSAILLLCISVFTLCSCATLGEYKISAKTILDTYLKEKVQSDFMTEDWQTITELIVEGKIDIDSSNSKDEADNFVERTKQKVDAILPKGGNEDIEFSATIDTSSIGDGIIRLRVKTKNVGEPISYMGSSTKIGASAEIFLVVGEERYSWTCGDIAVNADYGEVVIEKNEVIVNTFVFDNNGESGAVCPAGTYSLKLSYNDVEKIYTDIIKYQ